MENTSKTVKNSPDLPFPDFCDNQVVLLVILIAELLAIVLTFSHGGGNLGMLTYLAYSSLFLQSIALMDAAVLCYSQRWLARLSNTVMVTIIYCALQLITLLVTEASFWVIQKASLGLTTSPQWHTIILLRNLGISAIISAVVMRYFYVRHQWRKRLEAENRARVDALQARIRPHFLFNSMNTIASLIHSQPDKAEEAVLDLADLFRSTLASDHHIPLTQEINITKQYLRVESLRLGERLQIDWDVSPLDSALKLPALTLQPLVENAIYHGIEPLPNGGIMRIEIQQLKNKLQIMVSNPVPTAEQAKKSSGNHIALDNIRQRLQLHYGDAAQLLISQENWLYQVTITIPIP